MSLSPSYEILDSKYISVFTCSAAVSSTKILLQIG